MAVLDIAGGLPRSLIDRLRPLLNSRHRSTLIGGGALAAAVLTTLVLWSSETNYSVLFAGLSEEEGGRAVAELQKLNIPYHISDGGRLILVPHPDVGFARLQLAARGVPKQDGDQWSLLDNESLGVSPFVEQVHYARAVETALARTIRGIDGVVSATVKLALPKESDFLADAPKPSAAVMVRLRPGIELTTAQTNGIVGIVAAGVPGLSRENVTLVDQSGRVLSSNGKDGLQQVPEQLEIVREVARRYEAAVTDLLAPVLGRGNFRVSADADIDFSHVQESSVKYGESHVLSQDESVHSHPPNDELPIGIPGALSNRPPATPTVTANPPPAPPAVAASPQSPAAATATAPEKPAPPPPPDTHRTTNFDIDRTVQALERPGWKLRAINIDVLINNPSRNPIPGARIQSINKLVSSVVGSGENRHVTVVDLPFADAAAGALVANPPWWRQQWLTAAAQNVMLGLAGMLVLAGGVLPLLRRSRANLAQISRQTAAAGETANRGVEGRAEPSMRSIAGTRRAAVIDTDAVRAMAANDPARTAQVIKEWIARDRNSLKRNA